MAAAKITDLTALTTIATGDLFVTVDISDTTMGVDGTNKKITWGSLMGAPGAIGGTTPAPGTFTTLVAGTSLNVGGGYIRAEAGTVSLLNTVLAFEGTFLTPDTYLLRDAENTLAMRNGTNDQTFKLYGLYTDASNYHNASFAMSDTALTISTQTAGTGVDNLDIVLSASGTGFTTIKPPQNTGGGLAIIPQNGWSAGRNVAISFGDASLFSSIIVPFSSESVWASYYGHALNGTAPGGSVGFNLVTANTITLGGKTSSFPAIKRSGSDVEIVKADNTTADTAIILSSPDGTRYRVTVANGGALTTTAA